MCNSAADTSDTRQDWLKQLRVRRAKLLYTTGVVITGGGDHQDEHVDLTDLTLADGASAETEALTEASAVVYVHSHRRGASLTEFIGAVFDSRWPGPRWTFCGEIPSDPALDVEHVEIEVIII